MKCARHGLGANPEGRCVLCARERAALDGMVTRHNDRKTRRVAAVVVAVAAGVTTFALLLAVCDRGDDGGDEGAADAGAAAER